MISQLTFFWSVNFQVKSQLKFLKCNCLYLLCILIFVCYYTAYRHFYTQIMCFPGPCGEYLVSHPVIHTAVDLNVGFTAPKSQTSAAHLVQYLRAVISNSLFILQLSARIEFHFLRFHRTFSSLSP